MQNDSDYILQDMVLDWIESKKQKHPDFSNLQISKTEIENRNYHVFKFVWDNKDAEDEFRWETYLINSWVSHYYPLNPIQIESGLDLKY